MYKPFIGAKMSLRSVTNLVKDEKGNRKIQSLPECNLVPMGK